MTLNYQPVLLSKMLFAMIALLIADTVLGGPLGLFFRGERHLLVAGILLVSAILTLQQQRFLPSGRKVYWRASYLWPTYYFLASLIWVFIIPIISGGDIWMAIQDAQSLLILPVATLLLYATQGTRLMPSLLKFVLWVVVVLALCQDAIWLWVEVTAASPETYYKYVEQYFNTVESISIFWQPSPTGGYVRVFWISSIWLVIAVYIVPITVGRYAAFLLEIVIGFAICASYTRGIWLSLILTTIFCTAISVGARLGKKQTSIGKNWGMAFAGLCCSVALFSSIDYAVRGQAGVFARGTQVSGGKVAEVKVVEGKVVEESLAEREIQTKLLLAKWKERPLMGFGYGAYMPDHFSHDERPFLYEMMPVALLMKLGVVGFGLHLGAFLGLMLSALTGRNNGQNKLMFISASTAFFMAAHTNPILFSAVGMSILLLILIWWTEFVEPDSQCYVS